MTVKEYIENEEKNNTLINLEVLERLRLFTLRFYLRCFPRNMLPQKCATLKMGLIRSSKYYLKYTGY